MTEVATRRTEQDQKAPVALTGPLADLDQAYRMATALSQSALMPDGLRNKASDVLVTVLYGRELGLGPMQAIQSIHVIKGKPFISGQLWLSLVRRAGHRAEVGGDEKSATCTITRGDTDEKHTETFTLEQAKTAKLLGGSGESNWAKYPDRMLRWRAIANAARMICPEVALGFMAEGEEPASDAPQAKPTLGEVARERDEPRVDRTTGEIHDAEVVDDEAARREVEEIARQHAEPTDEDLTAMAAEMQPDTEPASTGLFGSE